jgi:hypothetical protein
MDEFIIVPVCYNSKYGTVHTLSSHISYITYLGTIVFKAAMLIWDIILGYVWRDCGYS